MKIHSKLFEQCVADIPQYIKLQTDLSFDIADKISQVLQQREITQKDLAIGLDVSPSVVSQWLSGQHNFTLKTIARISTYLGIDLIKV